MLVDNYKDLMMSFDLYDHVDIFEGGKVVPESELLNRKLIITDFTMPVENGKEIISKVRKQDSNLEIWVYSGNIEDELHDELIKLGANRVIFKPYPMDKFIQEIKEFLSLI